LFRAQLYRTTQEHELICQSGVQNPFQAPEIRAILLDVEGTTTPIEFVLKTLFPFSSSHAERFLGEHFQEREIADLVEQLRKAEKSDAVVAIADRLPAAGGHSVSDVAAFVQHLIAKDSKITPLKTLQGKIWEEGFRRGELKGEVYSDVPVAFQQWKNEGKRIAIFSSGSVLAQRLLFSHSTAGDLSSFLEAYFDTTTGSKREAASYQKIATALHLPPKQVLFVSDVEAELDAAAQAGMRTTLTLRPGVAVPANPKHVAVTTFN
jgi:enolase-phosphatase E1